MTEIFYDVGADPGHLEERAAAVIGYGNQGRAQTLNMRNSGGPSRAIDLLPDRG